MRIRQCIGVGGRNDDYGNASGHQMIFACC